jgi:hypothetical protein
MKRANLLQVRERWIERCRNHRKTAGAGTGGQQHSIFSEQSTPRLANVRTDGSFAFDEVVAGTYYIAPARIGMDLSGQELGGTTVVEARDEDVSDVTLRLLKAPDLTGRIRLARRPQMVRPRASLPWGRRRRTEPPQPAP